MEPTERLTKAAGEAVTMADLHRENGRLRAALLALLSVVEESNGVYGYHLNGELAPWSEFDEVIKVAEDAANSN